MAAVPSLTVLVYTKDSQPVAHCLEMDFVTTGRSRDRAVADLFDTIRDQVQAAVADDALRRLFRPAPQQYWARLADADRVGGDQILLSEAPAAALHTGTIDVTQFACAD